MSKLYYNEKKSQEQFIEVIVELKLFNNDAADCTVVVPEGPAAEKLTNLTKQEDFRKRRQMIVEKYINFYRISRGLT
jgi:hypothetical protein